MIVLPGTNVDHHIHRTPVEEAHRTVPEAFRIVPDEEELRTVREGEDHSILPAGVGHRTLGQLGLGFGSTIVKQPSGVSSLYG
jgi:hypothetical protein